MAYKAQPSGPSREVTFANKRVKRKFGERARPVACG